MKSLFKFDRKFGWSEIFAVAALAVAGLSLWQSQRALRLSFPKIEVQRDAAWECPVFDFRNQAGRYFVYNRLLIKNTSGVTTTLIGLRPNTKLDVIYANSNDDLRPALDINVSTFVVNELIQDVKRDPELIFKYEDIGSEKLSILNQEVEAGKILVFQLGTIFDVYAGQTRMIAAPDCGGRCIIFMMWQFERPSFSQWLSCPATAHARRYRASTYFRVELMGKLLYDEQIVMK